MEAEDLPEDSIAPEERETCYEACNDDVPEEFIALMGLASSTGSDTARDILEDKEILARSVQAGAALMYDVAKEFDFYLNAYRHKSGDPNSDIRKEWSRRQLEALESVDDETCAEVMAVCHFEAVLYIAEDIVEAALQYDSDIDLSVE